MGKLIVAAMLTLSVSALVGYQVCSQPPGGPGGPGGQKGPPKAGKPKLGMVLPPFVRDQLNLTDDQKRQIDDLEKEVKTKLQNILTPAQQKLAEESFMKKPPPPPGPGGPGGKDGPPPGKDGPPPPPDQPEQQVKANAAGKIQWFATLESGLHQAKQAGKPILLVSATPHCAGVSGIW